MASPLNRLPLEHVERAIAQLWEDEARRSGNSRIELMTVVALVSEPSLGERARKVIADVVKVHPSRTIVVTWEPTAAPHAVARTARSAASEAPPAIVADVALHRLAPDGPACGDAIVLEATGEGREWLPDNVERLALADLPVCLWWVGDLPDFDHLLERMLGSVDAVVVNSGEMDLRDLEKLSQIAARPHAAYAVCDLSWVRLRVLQELVARFFDDETSHGCLASLRTVTIEYSPREHDPDAASTQAALLFGWIAQALGKRPDDARWTRGERWSEVEVDGLVARFVQRRRDDVPPGLVMRVTLDCDGARFDIERRDDPGVFRWCREVPGVATPPQTLRSTIYDESTLLARTLESPRRNALFEASLHCASRIVRPVAPRLSERAPGDADA